MVAVDPGTHELLGTVTFCLSRLATTRRYRPPGEAEFRMLAVAPGSARAGHRSRPGPLVRRPGPRAGLHGRRPLEPRPDARCASAVRAHGLPQAARARLVSDAGDHSGQLCAGPRPMTAVTFCDQCGEEAAVGDHLGCAQRRTLEPPRYCSAVPATHGGAGAAARLVGAVRRARRTTHRTWTTAQATRPSRRSSTVRSCGFVEAAMAASSVMTPSRMSVTRCWSKVCMP